MKNLFLFLQIRLLCLICGEVFNTDRKCVIAVVFFMFGGLFLFKTKHLFFILLSLEAMVACIIPVIRILDRNIFLNNSVVFTYIRVSVCGACLGLSILVRYSRVWGNEIINSL
jgi:NADH:ubiquinone oxidoreductase subunit K